MLPVSACWRGLPKDELVCAVGLRREKAASSLDLVPGLPAGDNGSVSSVVTTILGRGGGLQCGFAVVWIGFKGFRRQLHA